MLETMSKSRGIEHSMSMINFQSANPAPLAPLLLRREIVVGEVRAIAIRPDLIDGETMKIDPFGLDTIGRLGGSLYSRTQDVFELKRPDGR